MLIGTHCSVCRGPGGSPCVECAELFVPLGAVHPLPAHLDELWAAITYAEAGRPLVASIKYRNQRSAIGWLAEAMVAVLSSRTPPAGGSQLIVTWAPTSSARRRERGFDQAELLARAVARRLRLPARRLLTRQSGAAQTGRSAVDRRENAPVFRARRRATPAQVLLIDDVVTTGSTLSAAAAALRQRGTVRVIGLVAAATPPPTEASY